MKVTHEKVISGVEIWGGGGQFMNFEIWGGGGGAPT